MFCILCFASYVNSQTNVALNKTVITSTGATATNSDPANAIDGNESTVWTSVSSSAQKTVCIDLGKRYDISKIVLKWKDQYYTTSITVSYSENPILTSADETSYVLSLSTYNPASYGPVTDVFGVNETGIYKISPFTARYVAFRTRGRNNTDPYLGDHYELKEFEIYGVEHTDVPTSIENVHKPSSINAYPNPVTNVLNITSESTIKKISVSGLSGALLENYIVNADTYNFSTTNWRHGYYLLQVETNEGIKTVNVVK